MPEKEREIFCSVIHSLEFKYTISRARNSFGQNKCSLWLNSNEKIASCIGAAHDMAGVCLGKFIREYFPEHLKFCNAARLRGLRFYNKQKKKAHDHYQEGDEIFVDGESGFDAMTIILQHLGFFLDKPIKSSANGKLYKLKYFAGVYGEFKEISFWGLLFP